MTHDEIFINDFLESQMRNHNAFLIDIVSKNIRIKPRIEKMILDSLKIIVSAKKSLNPVRLN